MWGEHEQFLSIVERNWNVPVLGTKQYIICRRQKLLKRSLKEMNRKHFGHISTKANSARMKLKQTQISLHDNPNDGHLKAMVRELQ